MGYSDQKYYARPLELAAQNMTFGTATASGTNTLASPVSNPLPAFVNRTSINAIKVVVTTAVAVGAVAESIVFLNGTSTFGVVTMTGGTATAGQVFSGVITTANSTFAAAGQPTYELIVNTATASGAVTGSFNIYLEQQELPVNPGSGT